MARRVDRCRPRSLSAQDRRGGFAGACSMAQRRPRDRRRSAELSRLGLCRLGCSPSSRPGAFKNRYAFRSPELNWHKRYVSRETFCPESSLDPITYNFEIPNSSPIYATFHAPINSLLALQPALSDRQNFSEDRPLKTGSGILRGSHARMTDGSRLRELPRGSLLSKGPGTSPWFHVKHFVEKTL